MEHPLLLRYMPVLFFYINHESYVYLTMCINILARDLQS